MKDFKNSILFWVHNMMLIYFAYIMFPGKFVLGTYKIGFWPAILISALIWTLIIRRLNLTIITRHKTVCFLLGWLFNFISLWLVARIAPYSGFGVVKFTWLIVLALVGNIIHQSIDCPCEAHQEVSNA